METAPQTWLLARLESLGVSMQYRVRHSLEFCVQIPQMWRHLKEIIMQSKMWLTLSFARRTFQGANKTLLRLRKDS